MSRIEQLKEQRKEAKEKASIKRSLSGLPKPKDGDLRVWWIPQIPMEPFNVPVDSVAEAKLVLKTLADYDLFQFAHNVKPDYSNAGGLNVFDGGEWCEWNSADGLEIDDIP